MSALSEMYEVSVLPLVRSVSTNSHGPWQMAAIGRPDILRLPHYLPCGYPSPDNAALPFSVPPGSTKQVVVAVGHIGQGLVHRTFSPRSQSPTKGFHLAGFGRGNEDIDSGCTEFFHRNLQFVLLNAAIADRNQDFFACNFGQ